MGNRNRLFPLSVAIVLALAACGGGGGGAGPALSGSVSGQVRQNGVGATGVTLRLAGPATGVTTTDSLGNYLFESLPDGSYTVTPEVAPQQVAPSARTLAVAGTPVLAADFDFVTWQVSGSVVQAGHGYPGATVTLRQAGAPDRTATTGWGGDYAFSGLLNGTYTVEAAAAGQSFTPRFPGSVTVTNESVAGCDFLLDTWSVTGAVEWSRSAWTGGGTAILTGEVTLVT